jgi:iron complex transport system substrate-binding protein
LGLRVEILPLSTLPDAVPEYERRFLALLGLPPERASLPPTPHPPGNQRLLLLGANGVGTGRGTFEDALLTHAGWQNYVTESGYVRLNLEKILADPPEAVLWAAPAGAALANTLAEHPLWQHAKPTPRRYRTDFWRWQCPGPWSWELARQLTEWGRE